MHETKNSESSHAASSERRNWGNIFNVLVRMVRNQQTQLQSFANHHKVLEERLQMQNERWVSDVRLQKDQISQMNGILMFEEKKRLLEAAKADLTLGCKHREASILKWILEHTEDELADFKAWFEYLSYKSTNGEFLGTVSMDKGKRKKGSTDRGDMSTCNSAEKEKCSGDIKDELRRLKGECEKLALEKSSEVSALLTEKNFVWNQYNIIENDYTNKLRTKQAEVEEANEKIKELISSMEQLQSENNEKNSTISKLESKVADMEAETERLNKEISELSTELESLRKDRNNQVTPVLNNCREGTKTSDSKIIRSNRSRRNITSNKEMCTSDAPASAKFSNKVSPVLNHCMEGTGASESKISKTNGSRRNITLNKEMLAPDAPSSANFSDKEKKSLKRKEGPAIPTSETPKLFSSSFKVPKLKSSPKVR